MNKSDLNLYASTAVGLVIVGGFFVLAYQGRKELGPSQTNWNWYERRPIPGRG